MSSQDFTSWQERADSTPDEIKRRVDLEALGAALGVHFEDGFALCPWHADSRPSFHYFTGEDGAPRYSCFPCGRTEDAIGFVRDRTGCSYKEAVEYVKNYATGEAPPASERVEDHSGRVARMGRDVEKVRAFLDSKGLGGIDAEWLMREWRVRTDGDALVFPYYGYDSDEIHGYKFRKGAEKKNVGKLGAYGEWKFRGASSKATVVLCEGETDTIGASWLLRDHPYIVLGRPTAHVTKRALQSVELFTGRDVIVIADSDDPGRQGAREWAEKLGARVVEPPAGDVADWIAAGAGTADLVALLGSGASENVVELFPASSWDEVDLAGILAGDLEEPAPAFLARRDGVTLLYRRKVSGIAGEPESCKGWFACSAARDALDRGEHVVYMDFEDSARGVVSRMLALGVERGVLVARFHYVAPEEKLDARTGPRLDRVLQCEPGLVVLDGMTQALSNQGLSSNDGDEIGEFFRVLPRRIAREGAAVLLVDHVTKSSEDRGRYAIGSQMKLAAVDGAQFSAEVIHPFGRGKDGHVRIKVGKDRPGHVRAHAVGNGHSQKIAEMKLLSLGDGKVAVHLEAPEGVEQDGDGNETFRPTAIMDKMLDYLARPGVSPRRESVFAAVPGRKATKVLALDLLVEEELVNEYPIGNARAYSLAERSPNVPEVSA